MTDLADRFNEELDALRRVRDELRVQVHLAAAEVKDLWEQTEHRLERAESRVKRLRDTSKEELEDVGEATRLLIDEIGEAYRRIRDHL